MTKIYFKRMIPDATIPERATADSVGFDLRSTITTLLAPGFWMAVPTGIAIQLPPGVEGQIRPRSSLALKHGVTVLNSPGTIDPDYRGEIKVVLINHSQSSFAINSGDRIAQLVLSPYLVDVDAEISYALDETPRGDGGFGSTGV